MSETHRVSLNTMLKQLEGMHGSSDLNDWENDFVGGLVQRCKSLTTGQMHTEKLSAKQVETIHSIWSKHFA